MVGRRSAEMPSSLARAKAIFFDLDDTIYDFEQSMRFAFEHLHARFPRVFEAHAVEDVEIAYWEHYESYGEDRKRKLINTDPDRFRRVMWAGTLAALGHECDPEHALAIEITEEFARTRPEQWRAAVYPGARELLRELGARRVIGIITNGPSSVQRPKLDAIAYRELFAEPLTFVSGEFGAYKPDPSIFRAAAKAAGVEPSECVMVGDSREFDMPAKATGFRTVLFTAAREVPDCSADLHRPDAMASSYAELRDLLL